LFYTKVAETTLDDSLSYLEITRHQSSKKQLNSTREPNEKVNYFAPGEKESDKRAKNCFLEEADTPVKCFPSRVTG
jgi:hypothetical protein